ncbi:hypothetical protein ON010_g6960 [Phytophthora cinnamomi]|nr:hypothetical protein ON010_g6960 [Phytophthora cinnamomi]
MSGSTNKERYLTYSITVRAANKEKGIEEEVVTKKMANFINGGPTDFLEWTYNFNQLAKLKHWNAEDKFLNATILLEGDLREAFEDASITDEDVRMDEEFARALYKASVVVLPTDYSEKLHEELWEMKKSRGESLSEYSKHFRALVRMEHTLAGLCETSPMCEDALCRLYKRGLPYEWQNRTTENISAMLSKVKQMKANRPDECLIRRYTNIALNELAMKDALMYVKINGRLDKVESAENLQQIDELAVIINQAKRRRDTALATVLTQEWEGKQERLAQLLEEHTDATSSASHETLAAIHMRLDSNEKEIHALHINNRLEPDSRTRDVQFQELHELSRKVGEAMRKRSQLADQRKTTSMRLLRSNEELRMLTLELIDEADGVWE